MLATIRKMKEEINSAIIKLKEFRTSLNEGNLEGFEELKKSIEKLLDEKQRIIFSQIDFFTIKQDVQNENDDWLPF